MSTTDLFDRAVLMRQVHATIKSMYGPHFEALIHEYLPWLRQLATHYDGDMYAAAMDSLKTCEKVKTMAEIIAVAVELKLREVVSVMEGAKS